jgi:hypothetical protein
LFQPPDRIQLAALPHVGRDLGIRRVDARDVRLVGKRDVAIEIESVRPIVPRWILENRAAQRARRNADRTGASVKKLQSNSLPR